jgi:SAM-dependent methyltransferase
MDDLGDAYWWYRARREIIADVITKYVPPRGRIVDFGSGTGATAALLRDRGYRVWAAEISPLALNGCRRREIDVIDLRSNSLPERFADCIVLGDVLEHIEDEAALLAQIRNALVASGLLITTVPAYEFLWSGEDYISEHRRRYRRPQLVMTLEKGGFEVIWGSYFNTMLLPVIAGAIVLKRIFRPREMYKSDVKPLSPGLNSILYRIFRGESHLLMRVPLPIGASIIAIARPALA